MIMKTRKKNESTSYTYYAYDPESGRQVRHILTPGEEGVTEDWIILLQEMDHAEALQERYAEENSDYRDRNYKAAVYHGSETAVDPVEKMIYEAFLKEDSEENPNIEKLREMLWETLTEEQIDLVYDLFGACRKGTEIAAEQGVTQQAVDGRKRRILKKMRKLLEE